MSNLCVRVECLAGTDITDAINEAAELCRKLGVAYVMFSFNGKEISVRQQPDLEWALSQFRDKRVKYVIA